MTGAASAAAEHGEPAGAGQADSLQHAARAWGAATALALVCEALRRDPAASGHAAVIEAQLDRLRAGLADLEAARGAGAEPVAVKEPVRPARR